ncbi:MAG: B12-binding domain-containing radical SAM protein [Candidatus Jordarchaeum sp.]|uniref:B12-binding domain-containing radical SAM protein n=1 Tax=Candidatus Jordarchaeum sp. TaxID=2823881 RepID=UPI00404B5963
MKIVLVNVPYPFNECPTIPLGLCYIAAVAEKNGFEVEILDLLVSRFSIKKVEDKMKEFKPEIVGVGPVTISYPAALRVLEACKKFGVTTVIGGCHVSFYDREALREAPYLDIVVRGEGEHTFLDIIRGKNLQTIEGVTYREDGEIIQNPPRKFIENLDEIPWPARHLVPISKYRAFKSGCDMMTGRGCPYSCTFCVGGKMVGKKPRFRDISKCVDEIEEIVYKYGFDRINVVDDLLTINHKRVFEFCDELDNRGLKIEWTAFSRVDTVTKEILTRMKETGCIFILYGVESGNQKILNLAKKRTTIEKIRRGVTISNEVGITTLSSFILGLPGETKETIKESMEFGKSLGNWYGFHILSPYPGTEIRERAEELGLKILHNDWSRYDANQAITETKDVSAEYINKMAKEFYQSLEQAIKVIESAIDKGEDLKDDVFTKKDIEEVRLRKRRRLVWQILKHDYIERNGRFTETRNPVELLTEKLYTLKAISSILNKESIAEEIRKMFQEGVINYAQDENSVAWYWTNTDEQKKTISGETTQPLKKPATI